MAIAVKENRVPRLAARGAVGRVFLLTRFLKGCDHSSRLLSAAELRKEQRPRRSKDSRNAPNPAPWECGKSGVHNAHETVPAGRLSRIRRLNSFPAGRPLPRNPAWPSSKRKKGARPEIPLSGRLPNPCA